MGEALESRRDSQGGGNSEPKIPSTTLRALGLITVRPETSEAKFAQIRKPYSGLAVQVGLFRLWGLRV